jgi:hypothetical protein
MAHRARSRRPRKPAPAPSRPQLLEANETVHKLFFKAQVDRNEFTGAAKTCIIPDIVLSSKLFPARLASPSPALR